MATAALLPVRAGTSPATESSGLSFPPVPPPPGGGAAVPGGWGLATLRPASRPSPGTVRQPAGPHPRSMEAFVNFTNQTRGRDRLFRATQYTCMLLSYLLERKTDKGMVIVKLKELESSMRFGRKLFRLGNMVHAMVAVRRTSQLPDLVLRLCLTASNFSRGLYFICDTVLWVKSVGLILDVDKQKWRNWATKCYYYSLLMNLARDVYEISWRMEKVAHKEENSSCCDEQDQDQICIDSEGLQPFLLLLYDTLRKNPPLLLDTMKNLCDLSSPLDRLGIYKTNPGVIGFCGLLSSLVGILTVASPQMKLKH
uniref:Peroxisomal biogenesis factor 11 alpha n=1 Tax=Pelusios castaneus TaxID=367368 RepID=A0A8C8SX30_9SAUR